MLSIKAQFYISGHKNILISTLSLWDVYGITQVATFLTATLMSPAGPALKSPDWVITLHQISHFGIFIIYILYKNNKVLCLKETVTKVILVVTYI